MGNINPGSPGPPQEPSPNDRLNSWKEIAAYLKRDVRTLHRWEAEEGLPIRRHLHKKRGSVYAYKSEIEAWWNERRLSLEKPETASSHSWTWRRLAFSSAVLLLVLSGSVYFFRQRAGAFTRATKERIVVAVLPFENLSGDREQEYFSDGLTEEIIGRMGSLDPHLAVIARASAMRYKKTNLAVGQIGRELGADYLLQGSVRRDGESVHVSAELVQVHDQTHIWAQSYQRDFRNLAALQADLTQAVAAEIRIKLEATQRNRLAMVHSVTPEAHEAYLKGLYFWNKYTEEGMREAIEYFQKAITLDPEYADAYAGLGSCYGILGNFSLIPPNESFPRNKVAALKAIEIDPTVSEAHTQLGYASMFYDRDWARAGKEFRRALELNPNDSNAHRGLAQFFLSHARFDDALAEIERARELDPVSLGINSDRGWYLHFARRPDEAIAQLRKTLELDASFPVAHFMLGNAYELKGEFDQAISEYQKSITGSGSLTGRIASLGHAYAMAGRKNEAREILSRLKELSGHGYVSPYHTALVYVALGEQDKAFSWLEKSYDDHFWMMAFLKVDPRLDPLRSDPRFSSLLRRIGLPE